MYVLVVYNVGLYWLVGAEDMQDDFAPSLSTQTYMVHNVVLSV